MNDAIDRSSECKCECHTGGAVHIVPCSCYRGEPVLDGPQFSFGANPPPEWEWMIGKTVEEINKGK